MAKGVPFSGKGNVNINKPQPSGTKPNLAKGSVKPTARRDPK